MSIGQGWKVLNILKMISFSNRKASVFNFEGFLFFFFLLLVSSMDFYYQKVQKLKMIRTRGRKLKNFRS